MREQGTGAYDFSHDRIREMAYAKISLARRRLLHRRVAEALERIFDANLAEVGALLAAHYEQAGMAEQGIRYYWQAVENARQRFTLRDTLIYLRKGLALIENLPDTTARGIRQLSFALALGFTLTNIEGPISLEVRQVFAQTQRLSQQLGRRMQQYEAQRGLSICYLNRAIIRGSTPAGSPEPDIGAEPAAPPLSARRLHQHGDRLFSSWWICAGRRLLRTGNCAAYYNNSHL